mmetsp:Transcript_77904/g.167135  ORF Transcript_77904/g.167135 Transcript_77904/m.167135 type:complete len:322 (-) Transcript_77904:85-1050(-)
MRAFGIFALLASCAWAQEIAFTLSLADASRGNRSVSVKICLQSPELRSDAVGLDLFLFAHGGGLFAEDYAYLCEPLPGRIDDAVIARLVSPEDDDPMDLSLMASDLLFLIPALQKQRGNASSPLYEKLSDKVILAGHSMGAAAAILAGAQVQTPLSILALAPGFWGDAQVALLRESACFVSRNSHLSSVVVVAGDQDCANSVTAQARPIWGNLTSCSSPPATERTPTLTLAVLHGVTHCQWTAPTKGQCDFDVACSAAARLPRSEQQTQGKLLLSSFSYAPSTFEVLQSLNASYVSSAFGNESLAAKLPSLCPCAGPVLMV